MSKLKTVKKRPMTLLRETTKAFSELDPALKDDIMAWMGMMVITPDLQKINWLTKESCQAAMSKAVSDGEQGERAYKNVGILGSELLRLRGFYLGKRQGFLLEFEPINRDVLGNEGEDITIELPMSKAPDLLIASDKSVTFKDYLSTMLKEVPLDGALGIAETRIREVEAARDREVAIEKQANYGSAWGAY